MANTYSPPDGFPCFTKKYHHTLYAAIDTKRPELSLKGKTAIVTGAGSGIGRATAQTFADAGATTIHLLGGRRAALLDETKDLVTAAHEGVFVHTYPIDISDRSAVKDAVTHIANWDVIVLNAGFLPSLARFEEADLDDWFNGIDINLKGNLQIMQSLLPKCNADATLIGTSSCAFNLSPAWMIGMVPYTFTKIALVKMFESLAAEVPETHFVTFHPGSVETDMLDKAGLNIPEVPKDDASLPTNFAVWLASSEARFLRGKFVWTHWDVPEMMERADEIKNSKLLTANLTGWPFGLENHAL